MAIRPLRALEQLYYLGLVDTKALTAVDVRRSRHSRASSKVIRCLLFGPPGCGKTLLTNAFTSYSFLSPEPLAVSYPERDAKPADAYAHLLHNVHTVVDKETGAQRTLIISEVSEGVVEYEMVEAIATSIHVDMVCYLFDGTEPDSFEYIFKLQAVVSDAVPCVYAYSTPTPVEEETTSLLALDKCMRHCASLKLHAPLRICLSSQSGFDLLYQALVHRTLHPHDGAVPFTMQKAAAKKRNDRLFYGGLVAVAAVAAGVGYAYADELKELSVVQSLVRLWDQSKLHLVPKLKQ